MYQEKPDLPSNKKFGFFFCVLFFVVGSYAYLNEMKYHVILFLISGVFGLVALAMPDILLPLNRAWMYFGLMLGKIVSPLVLGSLFFGIITPVAFIMRVRGRDALKLNLEDEVSFWIIRQPVASVTDFKEQF